jgi:Dolichyl-phosphate-mannose-protein mannosyltransferase
MTAGTTASRRDAVWQRIAANPVPAVFALALLVRLTNLAFIPSHEGLFTETDAFAYWLTGSALAYPETLWTKLAWPTDRMPLYPLLLAGIQSIFGDAPRMAAFLQAGIDAGTCALIAALGSLLSPLTGLIAGVLAAVSVTLIVFSSLILTETLFLFFFTGMLLAGARFLMRPSNNLAVIAGLAGGFALATRPAIALLLLAAVPAVFFVVIAKRRRFASAITTAVLFAVSAALPVAPVVLRNGLLYGSFSLTSQTGDHLALWIVPLVTQRADGTPYQTTVQRMEALFQQRLAERGLTGETNPFRRAAIKAELAKEHLARLPASAYVKSWIEGMAVNLGAPALTSDPRVRALPKPSFYNTPGASLWERAIAYLFDDPGLYQALLVLGIIARLPFLVLEAIGFVMLARTWPWAAAMAAAVLAYFLLLSGPVAAPKYRMPMEPVLIVLAAIPLARLAERHTR